MSKFLKNSRGFTPIVDFDEVLIKSKHSKEPSSKFTTGFTPIVDLGEVPTRVGTSKTLSPKFTMGFTLIEPLVVIAIIGILSSVVVVSINAAREKSKIASIKSTLKQLYNQAAINQVENGSFIGSNPSYSDLTCSGNLAPIVKPLEDQGIVVKCFSFDGTPHGSPYTGDIYQRFGATALIYDAGELKAWSVDENGVVKWDTHGVEIDGTNRTTDRTMAWEDTNKVRVASDACAKNGGRLPSIEQLRTLYWAYYQGAGATSTPFTPTGFVADSYWSSTPVPSSPTTLAYFQVMHDGNLYNGSQGSGSMFVVSVSGLA